MTVAEPVAVPAGRIQTLTPAEELVLKQVWANILSYIDAPTPWPAKQLERPGASHTRQQLLVLVALASTMHTLVLHKLKKSRRGLLRRKLHVRDSDAASLRTSTSRAAPAATPGHGTAKPAATGRTDLMTKFFASTKLLPREVRGAIFNMLRVDTPDNLVLRFVRARKWDVEKAVLMLCNTIKWRLTELHPDDWFRNGDYFAYKDKDMPGLIVQVEKGKSLIAGHDKEGRPVVYVRVKLHKPLEQNDAEMAAYTALVIEYCRMWLREPMDTCSVVFDMTGFTLSNMDYAPVKFLISAFEAHYPELLGLLFVHNAPWVFSGIWNVIKKWLDPVVASKIRFTKSKKDLLQYFDESQLHLLLGGHLDFEWKYVPPLELDVPKLDPEKKRVLEEERERLFNEFHRLTLLWVKCDLDGANGKLLRARLQLALELVQNFCLLDPYVRYRGVYDRLGMVRLDDYVQEGYGEGFAEALVNGTADRFVEQRTAAPFVEHQATAPLEGKKAKRESTVMVNGASVAAPDMPPLPKVQVPPLAASDTRAAPAPLPSPTVGNGPHSPEKKRTAVPAAAAAAAASGAALAALLLLPPPMPLHAPPLPPAAAAASTTAQLAPPKHAPPPIPLPVLAAAFYRQPSLVLLAPQLPQASRHTRQSLRGRVAGLADQFKKILVVLENKVVLVAVNGPALNRFVVPNGKHVRKVIVVLGDEPQPVDPDDVLLNDGVVVTGDIIIDGEDVYVDAY